jgi:cytochrome c-type biogenesis protein CcmH/NrfG
VEEQKTPQTEVPEQSDKEKQRLLAFMERLDLRQVVHSPIRKWMAWAGLVLFVALIVAYYLTTGGQ